MTTSVRVLTHYTNRYNLCNGNIRYLFCFIYFKETYFEIVEGLKCELKYLEIDIFVDRKGTKPTLTWTLKIELKGGITNNSKLGLE